MPFTMPMPTATTNNTPNPTKPAFHLPPIPASAPVTPAYHVRPADTEDIPPATPQRLPRAHASNYYRSPITPASASTFSPLSRSSWSPGSSALNTPGSLAQIPFPLALSPEGNINAFASPDASDKRDNSGSTEDWRSRASENGIRVAAGCEDTSYTDDEGT
ncbi:hypothetical protein EWM64_g3434 [Hericium alpestre]|uniref:Uncharacterized protein n=1 Tax=Hericium alpestre TaxID=135208 RepID=A0A4Z0A4H7_9AGAM|nr:hypothetical protein EWM64_g3434 [Hericium alpestre]